MQCGQLRASRLRLDIVCDDEAIDGCLQIDDRDEDTALQSPFGELCEGAFGDVSQHDVGAKCGMRLQVLGRFAFLSKPDQVGLSTGHCSIAIRKESSGE
jgi:hypothetical protein